jgi:hypothetical protein
MLLILFAISLLANCNGDVDERDGSQDSDEPQSLVGTISEVTIDPDSGHVSGFTLDSEQGPVEIRTSSDVDYGFNLHHLFEHEQTGDPVIVMAELRDASLVALTIEDYGS